MAIVVIGGQSRSLGKTSVVRGLIAALPSYHWTAFKITQFGHGRCSVNGKACDCATPDHRWAMSEEREACGTSDTSRFLQAGAKHAFWVRSQQGRLAEALPAIRRKLMDAENAIIESNRIVNFIHPDLYLTILDPGVEDFKSSARLLLDRADGVILHHRKQALWSGVSLKPVVGRPVFSIQPPPYLTDEIIAFVARHLEKAPHLPA